MIDREISRTALRVMMLSAGALLLETTLTRLLAVAQYYHFAFLVVSLALLGFGASGSLLTLFPFVQNQNENSPEKRISLERLVAISALLFVASTAVSYGAVNLLPFDSYSIAWDRRQIVYFVLYFLSLLTPFLFAGFGIGAALAGSPGKSHQIYAANLFGSGLGVFLAPAILWLAGVPGAVLGSGLLGLLASADVSRRKVFSRLITFSLLLIGGTGFIYLAQRNLAGDGLFGMTISPYKDYAQVVQLPETRRLYGRWSPSSRVDVVAATAIHNLPGLSYAYQGEVPPQLGLSVDADALQPITLAPANDFPAGDYLPEAPAFLLRPGGSVAVLEPGGGLGVLQALHGGAENVAVVFDDFLIRQAVAMSAPEADLYRHPQVQWYQVSPRVFLSRTGEKYDLLYLPLTDSYRPVTSGAYSLSETYLLTVEAFSSMLDRLQTDGILVTSRWLQTPPSESLRLIATLVSALERRGHTAPEEALVAYRGIQTMTVLVQQDGWSGEELAAIREFVESRRYDLVWAPDISPQEVNRFNRLSEPAYYEAVQELLAAPDQQAFFDAYPFAISPPTDDRPFFFHFFRWSQTPELVATLGRTWQPFGGSGYFLLFILLGILTILGTVLILLPLWFRGRLRKSAGVVVAPIAPAREGVPPSVVTIFTYFSLLGIAFLFVEIPLIQRWILLVAHPTYAFTLVVGIILAFSSLGSWTARAAWFRPRIALLALVLLAVLVPLVSNYLTGEGLALPMGLRVLLAGISLAILAFFMGVPFPLGIAWLEAQAPRFVPWAWAVNGCLSVIASVLAAILSISYGFTAVLFLGAAAYAGATLIGFKEL